MSRHVGRNVVYVGNLPDDVKETEVEDLFKKYGKIRSIDLKLPPRPPPFAFVVFDDARDAEDSVDGRNGYEYGGCKLRVEIARGGGPTGRAMPPPITAYRNKGSAHRVKVVGLPNSASWQDLKDHFRRVVKPNYTNVFRDRDGVIGIVEFDTQDDLQYAIRKLDDTEFKNPFDRSRIRLVDESTRGGGRYGGRERYDDRDYRDRDRERERERREERSVSRSR